MDKKTIRHAEILADIHAMFKAKNADYGDSFSKSFKKHGLMSVVPRIADKFYRLESLAGWKDKAQVDESIRDTLLDLANYCIMTVMELEEQQ